MSELFPSSQFRQLRDWVVVYFRGSSTELSVICVSAVWCEDLLLIYRSSSSFALWMTDVSFCEQLLTFQPSWKLCCLERVYAINNSPGTLSANNSVAEHAVCRFPTHKAKYTRDHKLILLDRIDIYVCQFPFSALASCLFIFFVSLLAEMPWLVIFGFWLLPTLI
jgi:hypothetical protein